MKTKKIQLIILVILFLAIIFTMTSCKSENYLASAGKTEFTSFKYLNKKMDKAENKKVKDSGKVPHNYSRNKN